VHGIVWIVENRVLTAYFFGKLCSAHLYFCGFYSLYLRSANLTLIVVMICLQPGMYVTLHIANVPPAIIGKFTVEWSAEMRNRLGLSCQNLA